MLENTFVEGQVKVKYILFKYFVDTMYGVRQNAWNKNVISSILVYSKLPTLINWSGQPA